MAGKDKHEVILEDLARSIYTPYVNIPLGSVWLGAMRTAHDRWQAKMTGAAQPRGTQIADVVAIKPSYTRFCVSIYEVKQSRADFLSDIRKDKWRGYLDHCHRFYFATPPGILDKKEIPPEAGWIAQTANGWTVRKAAPVLHTEIPAETIMSLLFHKSRGTARDKAVSSAEEAMSSYHRDKRARRFGKTIAEAMAKQDEHEAATNMMRRFKDRFLAGLCLELDIPQHQYDWRTEDAIEDYITEITKKAKEAQSK